MAERGKTTEIPRSSDAPSSWPDSLSRYAGELGRRVMAKWAAEVHASGRRFAVLYVPREREMRKPYEEQDSWSSWLVGVCRENEIDLVDPSSFLIERAERGEEIYYDHLAREGHAALADAFVSYFRGAQRF